MSETSAAQPPSQSATSLGGAPTAELLKTITKLQSDGLLLLDHLTKRPTRQFVPSDTPVQADNTAKKDTDGPNDTNKSDKDTDGPNDTNKSDKDQSVRAQASDLNLSLEPLRWAPDEVAKSPEMFPALVRVVDALARLAYPATPESIKRSRKNFAISDIFLLFFLFLGLASSVLLSIKVVEGRNLVVDSRAVQALARDTYTNLLRLNDNGFDLISCVKDVKDSAPKCGKLERPSATVQAATNAQTAPNIPGAPNEHTAAKPGSLAEFQFRFEEAPYCEAEVEGKKDETGKKSESEDKKPYYYRQANTRDAKQLCGQLAQQKLREKLIFARLQGWNCEMARFDYFSHYFLRLGLRLQSVDRDEFQLLHFTKCSNNIHENKALLRHWQRSELRASPVLHLMSQHLLPAALAMLGATIAILLNQRRARLDERLRDHWLGSIALVIMPTSLGALLGLVWGSGPDIVTASQIKFGDFSFGLGVVAFFIGFVFEDILNWLRRTLLTSLENITVVRIATK